MVRQPQSLAEAKQIFSEEKTKVTSSISAIAGSRWLMAILATLVLGFGTHLLYAPDRLPTVSGISLTAVGLPSGVDFGFVGEQAQAARDAAVRQGGQQEAQTWLDQNQDAIPLINTICFGVALLLLLLNMVIMTKRRPYTRG